MAPKGPNMASLWLEAHIFWVITQLCCVCFLLGPQKETSFDSATLCFIVCQSGGRKGLCSEHSSWAIKRRDLGLAKPTPRCIF